jgi:hypothetical protein
VRDDFEQKLVKSHCFYVSYEMILRSRKKIAEEEDESELKIGYLICTDWYLDENQLDFVHLRFYGDKDKIKCKSVEIDEYILMISVGFKDRKPNQRIVSLDQQNFKKRLTAVKVFHIEYELNEKLDHHLCYCNLSEEKFHIYPNVRKCLGIKLNINSNIFRLFENITCCMLYFDCNELLFQFLDAFKDSQKLNEIVIWLLMKLDDRNRDLLTTIYGQKINRFVACD